MSIIDIHNKTRVCQRNWDLSKTIPKEHLDIFKTILENPTAKQGNKFYDAIFSTNIELNEEIYNLAVTEEDINAGKIIRGNPQMLANLVILWIFDLEELFQKKVNPIFTNKKKNAFSDTSHLIMGINTGSLLYAASSLGYSTGFCRCFQDSANDTRITFLNKLGVENPEKKDIVLGLGIGYNNPQKNSRIDHFSEKEFKRHELIKPNVLVF